MSYKSSKLSSNESHLPYTTYTQVESRALDIDNEQQVSYCKAANALDDKSPAPIILRLDKMRDKVIIIISSNREGSQYK